MEQKQEYENEAITSRTTKNFKPFLSVFIVLILILTAYYFFWRTTTIKMKKIVSEAIKDYKYETIKTSGFPFLKKIKVRNATFSNDIFLMTKNQIKIDEISISSFVLSKKFNIKLKNISTTNLADNTKYNLIYNEEPIINLSFYKNGIINTLYYSDKGYRVVDNDNKTLYKSDNSLLDLQSVNNKNIIDYIINGNFQNMQNISIIEKEEDLNSQDIPEVYNMKFDISSTLTMEGKTIKSSVVKINEFNLVGDQSNGVSINGEIFKDPADPYSYGELKITLSNYKNLFEIFKSNLNEALNIELSSQSISNAEKSEYIQLIDRTFSAILKNIQKNPETDKNKGTVLIKREKNKYDYIINDESFVDILQNIIK